jgi:hypothetical protein
MLQRFVIFHPDNRFMCMVNMATDVVAYEQVFAVTRKQQNPAEQAFLLRNYERPPINVDQSDGAHGWLLIHAAQATSAPAAFAAPFTTDVEAYVDGGYDTLIIDLPFQCDTCVLCI